MKKIGILIVILSMVFSAAMVSAEWQPERPITLIVPCFVTLIRVASGAGLR